MLSSKNESPTSASSNACREALARSPLGVTQPLSIFAAARERSAAVGLRTADRAWTFGELAELTQARLATLDAHDPSIPVPLVGSNSVSTIVTIYALWERGVAPLLLHARLTDSERETLLAHAHLSAPLRVADPAAVLYTSGTTGTPRAAILTRSALVASAAASEANMGWRDDDCWVLCMPVAHVGGLSIVSRCLIARKCVALAETFDPAGMPRFIEHAQVTLVSCVPTMLTRLLDGGWRPPQTLRAVLLGGAAASRKLLHRASANRVPVLVTYGFTEACSQVATTPYALRHEPSAYGVGKPLKGIEVRSRDGHLEVRGPVLMAGYWNERPLRPDEWFETGDLGSIDAQGFIRVDARRQDLIVTGGENVYPVEVENVLEECPGVLASAVFGMSDELWGQAVIAAIVAQRSPSIENALREHIAAHLAPHKRPRRLFFVDRLPHTAAGKLDRAALPAIVRRARSIERA